MKMRLNENVTTQSRLETFVKILPMFLINSALAAFVCLGALPSSNVFAIVLVLGTLAIYFLYLTLISRDLGFYASWRELHAKRATYRSDRGFATADQA